MTFIEEHTERIEELMRQVDEMVASYEAAQAEITRLKAELKKSEEKALYWCNQKTALSGVVLGDKYTRPNRDGTGCGGKSFQQIRMEAGVLRTHAETVSKIKALLKQYRGHVMPADTKERELIMKLQKLLQLKVIQ